MPDETFLTVRGEARLEVEPEIATVSITVGARDKERRTAVEVLAARVREVGDLIKGYGQAVERLESQLLRVHPEWREADQRGGKTAARGTPAGYLAQAGFSVTVGDFAILGELVTALADQDLVSLSGPEWRVRPDSPVHREARLAAVRDALSRARDYAEAFGGRITGLAEAADSGLLRGEPGGGGWMASARLSGRDAARQPSGEQLEIDLEPAMQTVYAQIEARFTMSRAAFGL
jgi:uncharacterized protein